VATTRVPKNAVGAILLFAGLMGWVAVGSFAKFKSAFVADATALAPYLPVGYTLSYQIGNTTGFFFMCIASAKCWVVGIWVLCTPPSQWDHAGTQANKDLTVALDGGDYHGL
jgi:sugar phosphate permease